MKALDDATPTQYRLNRPQSDLRKQLVGENRSWFDDTIYGNPVNPIEKAALSRISEDQVALVTDPYPIKIGDICFGILGEIVGRDYNISGPDNIPGEHQRGPDWTICSPVESKSLAARLRQIWSSENPKQRLFESLTADFSTRGTLDGQFLNGWEYADELQINAIGRLLYYFPNESSALIARRIDELDVSSAPYQDRMLKNGISADRLVLAIRECKLPEIRQALDRLVRRAKCEFTIAALTTDESDQ